MADALLLAAGQGGRQLVRLVGHADALQQAQRPRRAAPRRPDVPQKSIGSITFSAAVSVGSSWKNWKTMPTVRPRQRGQRSSDSVRTGVPADHRPRPRWGGRCPRPG